MSKFLVLLSLLSPLASQAETFSCNFTEPFITIIYSTNSQKAVVTDHVAKKSKLYTGVTFQIVAAGEYVLKSKKGQEVARLKLTDQGSDGMSDTIYPYEIQTSYISNSAANNGIGGCSSSLLPEKQGPQ
jgi:uncharacterized membrane protein